MFDITQMVVELSLNHAGTIVMWFMVILSILSVAVMIERLFFFHQNKGNMAERAPGLTALMQEHHFAEAQAQLKNAKGFEERILYTALDGSSIGAHAVKELSESAAKLEKLRFERGLAFLGTIGNNAPFLGLFGTVLEIIAALYELGTQSAANASAGAVMGTLSQALAATAVGLLVAMPAVAMFNYFSRRLKRIHSESDAMVHILLAHLPRK